MSVQDERVCDGDCNNCPLLMHPNGRQLTRVLNAAYAKFGLEFYAIVQSHCPNMTCCRDCHIDDFCHVEGCELVPKEEA